MASTDLIQVIFTEEEEKVMYDALQAIEQKGNKKVELLTTEDRK